MDFNRYQPKYSQGKMRMDNLWIITSMFLLGLLVGVWLFASNKYAEAQMNTYLGAPNREWLVYQDKEKVVYQLTTTTKTCYRTVDMKTFAEVFTCN